MLKRKAGMEFMVTQRKFPNQIILALLLASLAVSVVLNAYLLSKLASPMQGETQESSGWIEGYVSQMWTLAIKLAPNKAVFYPSDHHFNVSVKAAYWQPLSIGNRTLYFKIFDRKIDPIEQPPVLVKEKAVPVFKSQSDLDWVVPIFNFTVTIDMVKSGIHLFSVIGGTTQDIALSSDYGCIASFAIKIA